MRVTANGCVGASDTFYIPGGNDRYKDDLAHLKSSYRTFGRAQWAQGTIYKAAGYTGNGGLHEMELLLLFDITSGNARGYEVLLGVAASGGYIAIVRWDGPLAGFVPLYDPGAGSLSPAPADGDEFYAQINSSGVITVKRNGSTIVGATATDTTYTTGQPGVGAWPVDGAVATSYGWKSFQAGNL